MLFAVSDWLCCSKNQTSAYEGGDLPIIANDKHYVLPHTLNSMVRSHTHYAHHAHHKTLTPLTTHTGYSPTGNPYPTVMLHNAHGNDDVDEHAGQSIRSDYTFSVHEGDTM